MQVSIDVNAEQFARLKSLFEQAPKRAGRALQRAVNKAGDKAKTISKRAVSNELGIKQADLTKPHRFGSPAKYRTGPAIDLIKAGKDKYSATLRISGRRIPVVYFKGAIRSGAQSASDREKGGGVTFQIGRRGITVVPDAFLGRGRRGTAASAAEASSGHIGVFKRLTKRRHPIHELLGPSIPYVAEHNYEFGTALSLDVQPIMEKELDRQIDLILAGSEGAA